MRQSQRWTALARGVSAACVSVALLSGCGGGSSAGQPAPAPSVTPGSADGLASDQPSPSATTSAAELTTAVLTPWQPGSSRAELDSAAGILRQELTFLAGGGTATVTVVGDHLVVRAPKNVNDSLSQLGGGGRLEFRPVVQAAPAVKDTMPRGGSRYTAEAYQHLDCTGARVDVAELGSRTDEIVACGKDGTEKFQLGIAEVLGTDVKNADVRTVSGQLVVELEFNGSGTAKFMLLTRKAVAQTGPTNRFAIVLDGVVYSAPSVQGVITAGVAQISGLSQAEAEVLVATLKYGALPLAFTVSTG